ncbi:MAG: hypothetical protein HQL35_07870 [Alphaproteobacteria bacterium]|nr:hypothetical protein [Alphaproteobacteria bacterium]
MGKRAGTTTAGRVWMSMLATGMVSGAGAIALNHFFPDWRLIHYPLHASVESVGAFAAFIIATLILGLRNHGRLGVAYVWVASALISMGFLDGLHALMHAGQGFVWLHSAATFLGGTTFMFVWAADRFDGQAWTRGVPYGAFAITAGVAAGSLLFPEHVPRMVVDGQFTVAARVANVVGGIGFLAAALYFVPRRAAKTERRGSMVFSSHCLLFGISGIIFEFSMIWDAAWWFWHVLRIAAYMIAVLFYFRLARGIEDDLARALESERQYSALQQQFVSLVSHEFRTPLAIIDGSAQRLLRRKGDITPEILEERLGRIRAAVERMVGLIDTTLYAARMDAGKIDFSPTPCDVAELVRHACANVAATSEHHQIQCDVSALPARLDADAKLLEHVFLNLLSNAIKYAPNAPRIDVSAWIDGNDAFIAVRDQGVGIPAGDLDKMFERFFRAKTSAGIRGTGLGLSVSRAFTRMHGGDITVESAEGEGSAFTVRLPLTPAG